MAYYQSTNDNMNYTFYDLFTYKMNNNEEALQTISPVEWSDRIDGASVFKSTGYEMGRSIIEEVHVQWLKETLAFG